MQDPIKIIHKFKNNNRRIQYKVYIFVGSLIPKEISTILELITTKDFYITLTMLNTQQYNSLVKYYGEFWYEKFFISYHINSQKQIINSNITKKNALIAKYNDTWYKKHIVDSTATQLSYSFASVYSNYFFMKKKIKSQTVKTGVDYRTYNIESKQVKQTGGQSKKIKPVVVHAIGGSDETTEDTTETTEESQVDEDDDSDKNEIIDEEEIDEHIEETLNLDDITQLYTTPTETSKDIMDTSKLISDAINDKKWMTKTVKEYKYDDTYDNISYDAKLEDVYNKYYIKDSYIYKDDTIKNMRNKIAVSIKLSNKFTKTTNMNILPEAQYFWSEYNFQNNVDMIMIGQKWVKRNELLKIDIKPNENIKVYEKLRNNLSYLKDSFGYKIKREDDETNILRFYEDFITNNEIFMLDLYNELGVNYNPDTEDKQNLYNVFINIYYPYVLFDRFEQIIQLLNDKNNKELHFVELQIDSIHNDIKLESEIENIVEKAKIDIGMIKAHNSDTKIKSTDSFEKLFDVNHIIQSIIHVNMYNEKNITGTVSYNKFNLYRIFDNFVVNNKYPFIQYQTPDGQLTYKIFTNTEKTEDIADMNKWFENAPYGISFKIKLDSKNIKTQDKYLSFNLHETGRIEYKITWKEVEEATITDVRQTYIYVRELLTKINSENTKIKFILPDDDRFKFAFINTIQKFTLPEKLKINHNDLSEFARFFFPYISLVIEPKKRTSNKENVISDSSKYGTYLRYKRISKYENRTKLHLRMLYFLRNYDLNDKELIDEIAKQFNITTDIAALELDYVREKYQKVIKKSFKLLKKLKAMPRSKPPGIGIDIQGRDRERYKIRITGARNKEQLDEIIDFMKVLIFLYVETYLYKKPEFQRLKNMLLSLTKIAKRRNKVIDIVEYDTTVNNIKEITTLDKARLGFRPEKGQNQWTRSCQNSGTDTKRRPTITPGDQVNKLIKDGYKLNNDNGYYEKKVEMKIKGKMYKTVIKAVKLTGDDNIFNFYSCDPSQNQEHMYIGFLARGNNPSDLCMPCCFKKDQQTATNQKKKDYFLKCIGEKPTSVKQEKKIEMVLGDKLYILQDTNKIQDGRFIYLPKYLDIFFNKIWDNTHKIINHYLLESKTGYFFKYTVKHEHYYFLAALANIFDLSIDVIINKMVSFIEADKNNTYFTYLNNGDIRESFKEKSNYINYIKNTNYLEYDIIGELVEIPGVITQKGIYFFILTKQTIKIQKALEKEKIKEKYYLECLNNENNNNINEDRDIVILIKENNYYFPIYYVQKDPKIHKKIQLQKIYKNSIDSTNILFNKIINELKDYHYKSCKNNLINQITKNNNLVAKNIINKLKDLKDKILIKKQYIDSRNKCKYIELDNNLLIPVIPSGVNYNYPISNIKLLKIQWNDFKNTIKLLGTINKTLNLDYTAKTLFYDKKEKSKIRVISILLNNELTIPVSPEFINETSAKNYGVSVRFQPLDESIDQEIINFDNEYIYDSRGKNVKIHNYKTEAYNLYRLEICLYLSDNTTIKEQIINIVKNVKLSNKEKKEELRKILFEIIDKKLLAQYKLVKSTNNKKSMSFLVNELPDLKNYIITNVRDYCKTNNTKEKCNDNLHCTWRDNTCKLQLLESMAIDFVNKIIEEMVQNGIKFKELIQESDYYVSDIVDYTQYSNRPHQKIINTSNFNINKLLSELFGKDKIPIIGRRQLSKLYSMNDEEKPGLIEIGKQLIQIIIPNKDSVIRAYANSYYWSKNPLYDTESRNLGYINELQTTLTFLFKAYIIDFVQNSLLKNDVKINQYLEKYFKNEDNFFESTLNKFRKTTLNTDGKVELFILSHIIDIPIIVYDNYSNIKYIFLQGEIPVTAETIKKFTALEKLNKSIFLKFDFDNSNIIPRNIHSIYYL